MRDHENHCVEGAAIIASLFGLKGTSSQHLANLMAGEMAHPYAYGRDEVFLDRHVFPEIKSDYLLHCLGQGWFGRSREHLRNPYEFVGNGWDAEDLPLYPPDNSSWPDQDRIKHRFASYPRMHKLTDRFTAAPSSSMRLPPRDR